MKAPEEILAVWTEYRSTDDVQNLRTKLSEQGYEYTPESIRNWLKGGPMPDFAFTLFSAYYQEKAKRVQDQVKKFKKLIGREPK